MGTVKIDTPVTINVDDLTLAELDRASKLVNDEGVGRTTAIVYVGLKGRYPGLKLGQVQQLRSGDVKLVDDADLADDPTAGDGLTDPTQ